MGLVLERRGRFFISLADSPSTYLGSEGFFVVVKADGTGVEFTAVAPGGGGTWGSITGTLTDQLDLAAEFSYHQRYNFMMVF